MTSLNPRLNSSPVKNLILVSSDGYFNYHDYCYGHYMPLFFFFFFFFPFCQIASRDNTVVHAGARLATRLLPLAKSFDLPIKRSVTNACLRMETGRH